MRFEGVYLYQRVVEVLNTGTWFTQEQVAKKIGPTTTPKVVQATLCALHKSGIVQRLARADAASAAKTVGRWLYGVEKRVDIWTIVIDASKPLTARKRSRKQMDMFPAA